MVERTEVLHEGADQLGETPLWSEKTRPPWRLDIERTRLQFERINAL